jgi:hypothetical protein
MPPTGTLSPCAALDTRTGAVAGNTHNVRPFLAAHPHVHLFLTPTYSSWLTPVELGLPTIERAVTCARHASSIPYLKRTIMKYIRTCHRAAKVLPVVVCRSQPPHVRITPNSASHCVD